MIQSLSDDDLSDFYTMTRREHYRRWVKVAFKRLEERKNDNPFS